MKKTIIALMSLGSTVFGATVGSVDTTDESLLSYFDFSNGNSPTAGSLSGWSESMTWVADGEYATTSQQTCMYNTGLNFKMVETGGFTVSFDIKDVTKDGTIFSLLNTNSMTNSNGWKALKVDIANNEESGVYSLTSTVGTKSFTAELGSLNDWTTVTLVVDVESTSYPDESANINVYVDGTLAAKTDSPWGLGNFLREQICNTQFGYYGNSGNNGLASYDNVLIYSRALSESEVKSLTTVAAPAVPEPTTATLSLLALAGLAARRRRK